MAERKRTVTEKETRVYTPKVFIRRLYDSVRSWLVDERGTEIIREYGNIEVDRWESYTSFPSSEVTLGVYIKKALLAENRKNVYALVLSDRYRSRYQHESSIGVEFGFFPKSKKSSKDFNSETPAEELGYLVHQRLFTYGSGEFFVDDVLNRVMVNCWADSGRYGGEEISKWPREKIQSTRGIEGCLRIVKRLERNAFVGL